jgi:tetratricopeptide (TPR) repeat protein
MVWAEASRHLDAGRLDEAETAYHAIRESLEGSTGESARRRLGVAYHQLGMVARLRGDLSSAESWYRRSLEIKESLGDRPGLAFSYGQLGLLAERQGTAREGLEWMVRCVTLFPDFPHPATGPGPHHLARLARDLGWPALEEAWRKVTGRELPANVRRWVEERWTET